MVKKSPKFTKKRITFLVLAALVIGASAMVFLSPEESPYETVIVERGELVQEVSVTGKVRPAQEVALAFERSGTIASVPTRVGDKVVRGEVLVRLNSGDVYAQVLEAQATLESQQAKLDKLKKGAREEEIAVQKTKVSKETAVWEQELRDLLNAVDDAFLKADDAVRTKVDQLFVGAQSENPRFDVSDSNTGMKPVAESGRRAVRDELVAWETALADSLEESGERARAEYSLEHLDAVAAFLNTMSQVANSLTVGASLTQAEINSYKSDVATARSNVQTAISNITTAEDNLGTAEAGLNLAEQELSLLLAGATSEEIREQEALVRSAEATLAKFEAELAKAIIRAPFSGVVTKQEARTGELAPANTALIGLISDHKFEVEAFIPEVDIALVEPGQNATFTLDAYEGREFPAVVASVNPAETVIEGVSTYEVTLSFEDPERAARSGMTANLDIRTATRRDVIAVPARAVESGDSGSFVRVVLPDGTVPEQAVETGIRGSDGRIEIVSGLSEDDEVVVFERR